MMGDVRTYVCVCMYRELLMEWLMEGSKEEDGLKDWRHCSWDMVRCGIVQDVTHGGWGWEW